MVPKLSQLSIQILGLLLPRRSKDGRGDRPEPRLQGTLGVATNAARMEPRRWPGAVRSRRRTLLQVLAQVVKVLNRHILT